MNIFKEQDDKFKKLQNNAEKQAQKLMLDKSDEAEKLSAAQEFMPLFNDKHTNKKLKDEQKRMRNISKSPQ